MHGSQPKYTVPKVLPDIHRAIRFVRFHAEEYQLDSLHQGIRGNSAGGHLSLTAATADYKPDLGAKDPVDRVASRVQAVDCFFSLPTDLVNSGKTGPISPQLNRTGSGERKRSRSLYPMR